MRPPRLLFVSVVLGVAAVLPFAPCRGQEPDPLALVPTLGEIDSLYSLAPGADGKATPAWLREAQADPSSLEIEQTLRVFPDFKKYDLSRPPLRRHWHRIMFYAVAGAPRDLIDALFGAAGRVPILGMATTGAMYEIVPAQVLMRPWQDRHRWPGYANRRGHGWIDARAWGFFPNFRLAKFASVDEKRLRAWRAHNERIDSAMQARGAQIQREKAEVAQRRTELVEKALASYRSADYRAVVRDLAPYVEIEPSDARARAMLVASLVSLVPSIPERAWARSVVGEQVRSASKNMLVQMKDELDALAKRDAAQTEPLFWLAWIDTRLRAYGEALEAAARLEEMDPANVVWRRLRFESALESRVPEWIDEAAGAIEEIAGKGAEASLHARGRQALAGGKPAEAVAVYGHLTKAVPLNPRYRYLLGMAFVELAKESKEYDKRRALREIGMAAKLARSESERDLCLRAREAARAYRPGKR